MYKSIFANEKDMICMYWTTIFTKYVQMVSGKKMIIWT